jgi:hypothetical protein
VSKYLGRCDCGEIKFFCEGEPFFTQYCHCNKCREIASLSKRDTDKLNYAFTAGYLTSHFHITAGSDCLDELIRNNSKLILCKSCHSLVYGISLDPNLQAGIGVNANNFQFNGMIPDSFRPVRHIWYKDRVSDAKDDLPKFIDAPKEQFGSGELYV